MAILSQMAGGSFLATGLPVFLPFAGKPDIVRLYFQGNAAGNVWAGATGAKEAYWNRNMVNGSALLTVGVGSNDQKVFQATNGITYFDPSFGMLGAPVAIQGITAASPAVVTAANHNLQSGDQIVISQSTGMLQISGMTFSVVRIDANTFSLPGLPAAGFAAPATGGSFRKVLYPGLWQPQSCQITAISQAPAAVITTSILHDYLPGQMIYLQVSPQFGMSQASQKIATILSVTDYTMTVDLDSTSFSPFAFPASNLGPFDFPNLSSYGVRGSLVLNPYDNLAESGILLGSAVCGVAPAPGQQSIVHYEILQMDLFE